MPRTFSVRAKTPPRTRQIAPRLLGEEGSRGPAREQLGNGLPPPVKAWIKMMAEEAGMSASFWLEKEILELIYPSKLRREIRYIKPKKKPLLQQRKTAAA